MLAGRTCCSVCWARTGLPDMLLRRKGRVMSRYGSLVRHQYGARHRAGANPAQTLRSSELAKETQNGDFDQCRGVSRTHRKAPGAS